mmetsp:Transcript_107481/g.314241  ORF Transcript_107481/g.314241 Transcript_107481/m.314241 type:complete len:202 (-) Transcript_107481:944-1549(-)
MALDDLLSVDSPDIREGRRDHLLFKDLFVIEVKVNSAARHVEDVRQHPLRHLPGVLVGVLLRPRQAVDAALAAVGVLLSGLDEDLAVPLLRVEPQEHNIHDAHELLVRRGVEHEACGTPLDLVRELLERPRVAHAELADVDVVVLEHLPDELRRPVHGAVLRDLAHALYVRDAGALHALLVPPLESEGAAGVPVVDGKPHR